MMGNCCSSHFCWFGVFFLFVFASAVDAKSALATRSGSMLSMLRKLPLPALTRNVEYKEDLGDGWQITGSVSGSLVKVEKDFFHCLTRGGWSLTRDYSLRDTARNKLHLYEWNRDGCLLLLMIEQRVAGLSNFRLGITQKGKIEAP